MTPNAPLLYQVQLQLDPVFKLKFPAEYRLGNTVDHTDGGTKYETEGAWNYQPLGADRFMMLAPRTTLAGIGPKTELGFSANPWTKVKLSPTAEVPCTYVHLLTAGAHSVPSTDIKIKDLVIDAKCGAYPVKALMILGAATVVENVTVTRLWGSRSIQEGEAFGILLNNAQLNKVDGGVTLKNCRVEAVPGSYTCAIYPGIERRVGKTLIASNVENCQVICPSNPATRSHCGYGLNNMTSFDHCVSHGFARGFFSDTGNGGDVTITNCVVTGCHVGVELRSSQANWHRRGLIVDQCTFVCEGSQAGWVAGIVLADDSPDSQLEKPIIDGVVVRNSTFYNSSPEQGHVGSSRGSRIAPVEFHNCRFIGKWDTAQADTAGWKFFGCRFNP